MEATAAERRFAMSKFDHQDGVSRRKVLECVTWCGTGVPWKIAGAVPQSLGIMGEAQTAEVRGLTLLQISDSHVGFNKPANPHALLSKEKEFDDADQIISQSHLDGHYVPGERFLMSDTRPARPEILLKTGTKTILLELGHEGKFSAKAQGWDENQVITPGEKIELSVVQGRWLIVKVPPAGHSTGKAAVRESKTAMRRFLRVEPSPDFAISRNCPLFARGPVSCRISARA
jgi:hypothetical protein